MSEQSSNIQDAQFAYVAAHVRQLDPSATDAAIARYLAEIETMAAALRSLNVPAAGHTASFTAEWPSGEDA